MPSTMLITPRRPLASLLATARELSVVVPALALTRELLSMARSRFVQLLTSLCQWITEQSMERWQLNGLLHSLSALKIHSG
jgi:hypothetical protein